MTPSFKPKRSYLLRRIVFFSLTGLTILFALGLLTIAFQDNGINAAEFTLLVLYAILFTWICLPFWTALTGFFICLFRWDRNAISATIHNDNSPITARTAIVMPIYNEDPRRVFAGLHAVCDSLLDTGQYQGFDIFVLSDTRDTDTWIEEEMRWYALNQELQDKIRIFYRNREKNSERKVGNIKDFCTQWGGHYRYMIVLDADSVMSGNTLVKMVRIMERNPQVGLLQVPPVPVNKESLFARIQQFASRVYGPIFTAGLNFWQLSEGNYWGHNAIIRVEAFVQNCGLPKLPGKEPLGGEILCHDFIEAALLRRAGWEVWLAYDLEGSYEELPPTLIDYAKRDRRWCQGNMQHIRFVFAKGFNPISRLHLLMGVMAYVASPLWLLFLIVNGIDAYTKEQAEIVYFFGTNLFPTWPRLYTVEMTTVLVVTLTFLFLPKLLSLFLLICRPDLCRACGGIIRVTISVLLETLCSALLAPILMLFQTKFVIATFLRQNIRWLEQKREDHQTGLVEALSTHTEHTIIGIAAGIVSYFYINTFFWWFIPVMLGMVLSVPLSMLLSNVKLGQLTQWMGLFLIPEETDPPAELRYLRQHLLHHEPLQMTSIYKSHFMQVLVEPSVNALHTYLLPPSLPKNRRYKHYLEGLTYQLLEDGAESLSMAEKRALLSDKETLQKLHILIWSE